MRFKYLLFALSPLFMLGCGTEAEAPVENPESTSSEDKTGDIAGDAQAEKPADKGEKQIDKKDNKVADKKDSEVDSLLDKAIKDKQVNDNNKKITADFHYKLARDIFNGDVERKLDANIPLDKLDKTAINDLNKARKNLESALEYNPKHKQASALLTRINSYLGNPESANKELTNRASQRRKAKIAQIMAEISHDYDVASQHLKLKEYSKAITKFNRLKSELDFVPYDIPENDFAEKIDQKITEAENAKKALDDQLVQMRKEQAEAEARAQNARTIMLHRNRIRQLFDKAKLHYDVHDYDKTIKLSQEVLKLDPDHVGAKNLIMVSNGEQWRQRNRFLKEKKALNYRKHELFRIESYNFNNLYVPMQFPDDFIKVTEKRKEQLFHQKDIQEEEWRTRLRGVLKKPMKNPLSEMPLEEIVKRLMSIFDVTIILNSDIDTDQVISLPVRNLTFEQVLYLLVERIEGGDGLTWGLQNGAIYIDSSDQFTKEGYITSYDVRDLIYVLQDYKGPELSLGDEGEGILIEEEESDEENAINGEDLTELIRNATGGDESWDDDNFNIEIRNGVILVNNTGRVHEQIQEILGSMRQQRALQVNILARFLTVSDRDLNHIGIDFRGLDTPLSSTTLEDFAVQGADNSVGIHFNTNVDPNNSRIGTDRGGEPHWNARGRTQYFLGNGYTLFDTVSQNVLNTGAAFSYQFLNDFQIEALIRATSLRQRFSSLVAPMITCFNTQRGNISVLQQESYIRDLSVVANVNAALFDPEIGYVQTGSTLDVRPIVSYDRKYITLQILPTNAQLVNFRNIPVTSAFSGANVIEAPTINYQAVRTAVSVPDRGSLLMGGYSLGQEVEDYQGLPFFSKVPILNFLTGASLKNEETTNNYFLVKAMIIDQQEIEVETLGGVD